MKEKRSISFCQRTFDEKAKFDICTKVVFFFQINKKK